MNRLIEKARVWVGIAFVRVGMRLCNFEGEELRQSVPPPRQPMVDEDDGLYMPQQSVVLNDVARQMVEDGRRPPRPRVEEKERLLEGSLAHRAAQLRGEV